MLIEELRGMLVHLGRLVVNGRSMLMCSDMPALMLLALALAVRLAHNPNLSRDLSTVLKRLILAFVTQPGDTRR
jgi:hypothetical protein